MDATLPDIGRRLHWLRRTRDLKQSVVAEWAGVAQTTVSRWERGEFDPDPALAQSLLTRLGGAPGNLGDGPLRRLVRTSPWPCISSSMQTTACSPHRRPANASGVERKTRCWDSRCGVLPRKASGLLPADRAQELHGLWAEFEAATTPDARFAKALDRLQPILLNHVVGGGTWTDYTVDEARERQMTHRIAQGSPTLWDVAQAVFADATANGWLRPAQAAAC